jgi:hypothetical protein
MLAGGTAYGPAEPTVPKAAAKPAADACATPQPAASQREIVICAERPNGYRLNPDIVEARKETRQARAGRLKTPAEKMRVDSCSVGPQGCPQVFNVIGAALAAVAMAKRVAEGKEIGSMFETTPQPDEYHMYLAAKQRREQREAEARAKAIAEAAKAKAKAAAADAAANSESRP